MALKVNQAKPNDNGTLSFDRKSDADRILRMPSLEILVYEQARLVQLQEVMMGLAKQLADYGKLYLSWRAYNVRLPDSLIFDKPHQIGFPMLSIDKPCSYVYSTPRKLGLDLTVLHFSQLHYVVKETYPSLLEPFKPCRWDWSCKSKADKPCNIETANLQIFPNNFLEREDWTWL